MKNKKNRLMGTLALTLSTLFTLNSCGAKQTEYQPTLESLSKHTAEAEWLKDAKLGIYFHWGPYVVPAKNSEWYPRTIYLNNPTAKWHDEKFGEDFHYHDFVPMFTAENFNAKEWADLFKASGAKFAGPVAEHHDGFSMWDSDVTPWNAKDMGPKCDILGELFAELRNNDLKTIATFHHARNLQRYKNNWEEEMNSDKDEWRKFFDSHYPYFPKDQAVMNDPKFQLLYGTLEENKWYEEIWLGKLNEVIDKYSPDIIWFDSWLDLIPEDYRFRFAAHYLNEAKKKNQEVVIVRKQNDLPLDFSILDHEKSRTAKAQPRLWMTDDTFSTGSWSYTDDLVIKPTQTVVHSLIDAVSKNGVLLLNISPKADGTIPQNQRKGLLELGEWLNKYGEAIYNTRPWQIAAEGPTVEPEGGFEDHEKFLKLSYTAKDVRYTMAKDGKTVYAMLMGIPEAGESIELKAFEGVSIKQIESMNGDEIKWEAADSTANIEFLAPEDKYAYILKITLN